MLCDDLTSLSLPVACVDDDHRAPPFDFLLYVDEARIQELFKSDCGVFRATEGGQDSTAGADPARNVVPRTLVEENQSCSPICLNWRYCRNPQSSSNPNRPQRISCFVVVPVAARAAGRHRAACAR